MRVVAINVLQGFMDTRQFVRVVVLFSLVQITFQLSQLFVAIYHMFHRGNGTKFGFLRHVCNVQSGRQIDIALIRCQLTKQQPEQTGLACAVRTGNTDMLSGMDGQAGGFE